MVRNDRPNDMVPSSPAGSPAPQGVHKYFGSVAEHSVATPSDGMDALEGTHMTKWWQQKALAFSRVAQGNGHQSEHKKPWLTLVPVSPTVHGTDAQMPALLCLREKRSTIGHDYSCVHVIPDRRLSRVHGIIEADESGLARISCTGRSAVGVLNGSTWLAVDPGAWAALAHGSLISLVFDGSKSRDCIFKVDLETGHTPTLSLIQSDISNLKAKVKREQVAQAHQELLRKLIQERKDYKEAPH